MTNQYASGNWIVNRGSEKEFIARWISFLEWTRASAPGLQSARLIQDADDSRHFISFASWDSAESMKTWRSQPEFARMLGACRELCDDFRGADYSLAAAV
jgi:heme-degrading monooxygenase HmoA